MFSLATYNKSGHIRVKNKVKLWKLGHDEIFVISSHVGTFQNFFFLTAKYFCYCYLIVNNCILKRGYNYRGERGKTLGGVGRECPWLNYIFRWFKVAGFNVSTLDLHENWIYMKIPQRVHKHEKFKRIWFPTPSFSTDPFLKFICPREPCYGPSPS